MSVGVLVCAFVCWDVYRCSVFACIHVLDVL